MLPIMEKKCLHSHVKAFVKTCYLNCKIKTMSILINYSKNICRDIWTLFKVKNLAFLAAGISVSKSVTLCPNTLRWADPLVHLLWYFTQTLQKSLLHCISHISKGFVSNGVLSPPLAFPFSFSCLQFRWHIGHVSLISIHFIIHLKNYNNRV